MIKKVLVGTDTTAAADLAVDAAAELARLNDADLLVVYARGDGNGAEAIDPSKAPDPDRYLGQIATRFPQITTEARKEPGDPARVLCRVAQREAADVIVVGNRGTHGNRRGYLRSVPTGVMRCSPCSVYVVDTRPAQ
jgi:nucleotide-binding universal stress UspA family protein